MIPRPTHVIELLVGSVIALAALGAIIPLLVDPANNGFIGPLLTGPAIAIGVLIGALVASGPRGRQRAVNMLFYFLRGPRNAAMRREYLERQRTDFLAAGRAPVLVALLIVGALVFVAKPFIAPYVERSSVEPAVSAGMPPLPPSLLAEMRAAAAAGDEEAVRMLAAFGPPEPTSTRFTFDGYFAERNIVWPTTALAMLLFALMLVLTPGGLSPPRGLPTPK